MCANSVLKLINLTICECLVGYILFLKHFISISIKNYKEFQVIYKKKGI